MKELADIIALARAQRNIEHAALATVVRTEGFVVSPARRIAVRGRRWRRPDRGVAGVSNATWRRTRKKCSRAVSPRLVIYDTA